MRGKPVQDNEKDREIFETLSWKPLLLAVLKAVGTGALILSVIAAPNLVQAYAYFGIIDDPRKRRRLTQKLKAMEKHGYLVHHGRRYGLTEKAEHLLSEEEFWGTGRSAPQAVPHAYQVHVCMFDIPVKKERGRRVFRALLRDLGYEKFQNSVFVCREDHEKLLRRAARFYGVAPYIRFFYARETKT